MKNKPIHEHVTSRATSLMLKDLGLPQNSIFYWTEKDVMYDPLIPNQYVVCSAYLASELAEWIAPYLDKHIWLSDIAESVKNAKTMRHDAESRGEMVVYLLKNRFLKIER